MYKLNLQLFAFDKSEAFSAKEGKVFTTIDGKVKEIATIIKAEAKVALTTMDVKAVGKRMVGKKVNGGEGTGSISMHFVDNTIRNIMARYFENGTYPEIEIQLINDDPTVKSGRTVTNLLGVVFSEAVLNSIDLDNDDALVTETDFTFDDYKKIEDTTY